MRFFFFPPNIVECCSSLFHVEWRTLPARLLRATHFELRQRVPPIDVLPPPVDLEGVVLRLLSHRAKDRGLLLQGGPHESGREVLWVLLQHEALLKQQIKASTFQVTTLKCIYTVTLTFGSVLKVLEVLEGAFQRCLSTAIFKISLHRVPVFRFYSHSWGFVSAVR